VRVGVGVRVGVRVGFSKPVSAAGEKGARTRRTKPRQSAESAMQ
jgi:hypothetical protein